MRGEREGHAFVRGEELLVVEVRQLERFGQDDGVVLDAVRSVHEIRGVELEQPAVERGCAPSRRLGSVHDLHAQQDDRRRVVDDDVEVERAAGAERPRARFDFANVAPSAARRSRKRSMSSLVTIRVLRS